MVSVIHRDVTEIALNNFKIQKNYKNAITVLKMFDAIGEIIIDCLDPEGYIKTNNFRVNGMDAVYRRLNVVAQFLSELKPLHILWFQNFDRVEINMIRWVCKQILRSITPQFYDYSGFERGFKLTTDVYLFSHNVVYVSIGRRLAICLDILKYLPDLTEWSPSDASFYHEFKNMRVNIRSDEKIITLRYENLSTRDFDIRVMVKTEMGIFLLGHSELPSVSVDYFDWTFEEFPSFEKNPLVYIYSVCTTVDKLLEVSRFFQRKVAIKPSFSHLSIFWIFKTCNVLLLKGYLCRNFLTLEHIRRLLNVVFSVVNRLLPEIITIHSNMTFKMSVLVQIMWTKTIYSNYEDLLRQHNTLEYPFYYDIINKYLFMYFYQYYDELTELRKGVVRTVIQRPFLPNKIGSNLNHWKAKFDECRNIDAVLFMAENCLCAICERELILNETEIAVLERCYHLCCPSCLLERLNVIIRDSESETLPESFKCPNSSCEMEHTGFVTDGQYDRIRTEAMEKLEQN